MAFTNNLVPVVSVVHSIVMEASTQEDRTFARTMTKGDIHQVNGTLVQKLYESVLERNKCDFGDIPKSEGDIEKVKYYESTVECIDRLNDLFVKNGISDDSITVIRTAISNVRNMKSQFTYAFKIKHEYMILMYNTIVMACIDSTSMLIAEYMNYIAGPAGTPTKMNSGKFDKSRGIVSLDNLKNFNALVKSGAISDSVNFMMNEQRKNFTGTEIVITAAIVSALLSVIPVTRELIFYYYSNRVSLSDYLETQAAFLENNKLVVNNSNKTASQKKDIIRKQEQVILKLRRLSDKLKINNEDVGDIAKKKIKESNSLMTLSNIEKSITSNKMNGQTIQFV
jgi:hypothetical protein